VNTKDSILQALRHKTMTVSELCSQFDVTRNAINIQLKQLLMEGFVREAVIPRSKSPGKPAIAYEAAPGSEDLKSKAYPVVFAALLETMRSEIDDENFLKIIAQTGRLIAQKANLDSAGSFDDRLNAAMLTADSLGATTQAINLENGVLVRNYSCPIGGLVHGEPYLCKTLATFFAEATNCETTEKCIREDRLVCQYFIHNVC
jgi:predicted ArsR family transcriptional regulator